MIAFTVLGFIFVAILIIIGIAMLEAYIREKKELKEQKIYSLEQYKGKIVERKEFPDPEKGKIHEIKIEFIGSPVGEKAWYVIESRWYPWASGSGHEYVTDWTPWRRKIYDSINTCKEAIESVHNRQRKQEFRIVKILI